MHTLNPFNIFMTILEQVIWDSKLCMCWQMLMDLSTENFVCRAIAHQWRKYFIQMRKFSVRLGFQILMFEMKKVVISVGCLNQIPPPRIVSPRK